MDGERLDIDKTLAYLNTDEKLRMLSGDGMWHTFGAGELPRVRMSDGSTGLRMSVGGFAAPATCFPTASMLANSWDLALMYTVGSAIGKEATAMGVNLLLAPGLNIKRSPLGGRNFEYFSEDPLLSGELGKAYVSGVQATGVGACIKHFAANNQEGNRMYSDSIVDRRALHELYLKPFEIALSAKPEAIMCAYNKLNGEYCSQNEYLLTTVLRDKWHYTGVSISDWGAVHDRVAALKAGLDLEMPDSHGLFAEALDKAYADGEITDELLDGSLRRILEMTDNIYLEPYGDFDADAHDKLSYNAAAASIVMLKNDGMLPLTKDMTVAVCGEFAEDCPFQGNGSSHVTALVSRTPLDAFGERAIDISYFRGYSKNESESPALTAAAVEGARGADAVIVYAGVPAPAEGVDRKSLELPPEQNALIAALTAEGMRVIVVLCTPGPVLMPWINRVRAVVYGGLNGQSGAIAAVDVLYGRVNPRGKLAETFPASERVPDGFGSRRAEYRESIFVGYKYYDRSGAPVLFPFGHGLSFCDISYDDTSVVRRDDGFDVTVTLTNRSARDAYEIVQIYVSDGTGRVMRPKKQLAGFTKVFVEGETTVTATVKLNRSAFEFYDAERDGFAVPDGEYMILVGASAGDIKSKTTVHVTGDYNGKQPYPEAYDLLQAPISAEDFSALYGELPEAPSAPERGGFTLDSCISDMQNTVAGKLALRSVLRRSKHISFEGSPERDAFIAFETETPLAAKVSVSDGELSLAKAQALVEMANGHFFKAIKLLLEKQRN